MPILVLAEHDNHSLKPSTLSTITAANQCGGEVHLLIAGADCDAVIERAQSLAGISQILYANHPDFAHGLAENIAQLIVTLASDYDHCLAPATTYGKNIFPRVAALLDVGQVSDVIDIKADHVYVRPIYAGNAIETVKNHYPKQIITVRPTAFDKIEQTGETVPVTQIESPNTKALSEFVSHELNQSERPELTSARVVVSGGRALQSAENFKLIESLADTLNAAVGASRAAVDAGFVPNDYQVGQTGKVVAPELYIAIGISGAIQHIAGMKDSKVIVAINKDADAPIFKVADYGLQGDLFDIIPKLNDALKTVLSQ